MRKFLRGALRPRVAACAVLTIVVLAAPAQARPGTMHLTGGGTATFSQLAVNVVIYPSGSASGSLECLMAGRSAFVLPPFGLASGTIAVHPNSASVEGEFTAMSGGGHPVAGTWTVNGLVDFQPYGCGLVPSIGATLPPNLCGGRLSLDVTFTAPEGSVPGRITVFCVIGPQAPPTHDNPTEAGEEGVTAVVPGIDNFNKQVSGMNVYVQQ